MGDASDAAAARRLVSLVPGVVYEWTPEGEAPVVMAEPPEACGSKGEAALASGFEVIAGYRLAGRLGAGQAGEVWRAVGPGGDAVALKFIEVGRPGGWRELAAQAAMLEVRHDNLVGVFGIWEHRERAVVGMELADGSLLDRSREAGDRGEAGMGFAELVDGFRQAARGIDFLNEPRHTWAGAGPFALIHTDIQPKSLLLIGGIVKVGDFGLLARLGDHTPDDPDGAGDVEPCSLITAFTAPEVRRGGLSGRSDQYSLAACYCHLRGGRPPDEPEPGAAVDLAMLPEAERPAVARALADDPESRWPTCSAFVAALAASADAPANPERPTRSSWLPAAIIALAASGLALAAALAWQRPLSPARAERAPSRPSVAARQVEPPGPIPEVRVEAVTETAAVRPAEATAPAVAEPPPGPEVETSEVPAGETASVRAAEATTPAVEPGCEAEVEAILATAEAAADPPGPPHPASPAATAPNTAVPDLAAIGGWLGSRGRSAGERFRVQLATAWAWAERLPKRKPAPTLRVAAAQSAEAPTPRTATVIVRMPSARAELVVRGEVGRGNPDEWYGPRRVIHTPPIDAPRDYLVGAFWTEPGGRPATRSVSLKVMPGRRYEVDLRAANPTAAEIRETSPP